MDEFTTESGSRTRSSSHGRIRTAPTSRGTEIHTEWHSETIHHFLTRPRNNEIERGDRERGEGERGGGGGGEEGERERGGRGERGREETFSLHRAVR